MTHIILTIHQKVINISNLFKITVILLFLQLASWETKSQTIQLKRINTALGLSESTNSFVYRDRMNYIWISSSNGLNRYDGKRLSVFHPIDQNPYSIYGSDIQSPFFEDVQGDIWFATLDKNGINVYKRQTHKFDHYFISNNKINNLSNQYTILCLERYRWLWIIADDKLFRFDTQAPSENNTQYLHDLQAIRFGVDTFTDGAIRRIVACYWSYKRGLEIIDYNKNNEPIRRRTYFSEDNKNQMPLLKVMQALIENDTLIWLVTDKGLAALNPDQPKEFKIFNSLYKEAKISRFFDISK